MQLNFAIPYKLTRQDRINLLTQDERDAGDQLIKSALALGNVNPETDPATARSVADSVRAQLLDEALVGQRVRVTADMLLARAVAVRYPEMARQDQRAWARVQDAADAHEGGAVELSAADAAWLVGVLFEPGEDSDRLTKAWDKFPAAWARWADALEAEARAWHAAVRLKK